MKIALVIISQSGHDKYYLFKNRKTAFNFLASRLRFLASKYKLSSPWYLAKYRNERVYSNAQFTVKILKTKFFKLRE